MSDTSPRKRRYLPRISLRVLLLLVIPISAVLAMYASRYIADRTAAENLVDKCPSAMVIWDDPIGRYFGSRTIFAHVSQVVIDDEAVDDKLLLSLPLDKFRDLKAVEINCTRTTDAGIKQLSTRMPTVEIWIVVLEEELLEDFDDVVPLNGLS